MRASMNRCQLVALLFAMLLSTGCGVTKQLAINTVWDPLHWDRYSDSIGRHLRDKTHAEEAWDEICLRDGDVYSRHYRRGFEEGFRDFMDDGGTGDPPVLPPRTYWRVYYQNPEGQQAVQDWFDGFRHGASVARASGMRNYVTVPLSSVPPREMLSDDITEETGSGNNLPPVPQVEKMGPFPEQPSKKPSDKEGPVKPPVITPPKTADGKPMPPPSPPIIQVERMIAPPVPNKSNIPK